MKSITEQCKEMSSYIIEIRRQLHQIPELVADLPKTRAFVCAQLDQMGIPYKQNTVMFEGKQDSSIVAFIEGKNTEKVIALRADMDALPVLEPHGVSYRSTHEGQMHACGHDNHVAMLLAAAKILNDNCASLNGSVKLFFQSAEEILTGSKLMLEGGCMENPKVTAAFGMHVWPLDPTLYTTGQFVIRKGYMMAAGDGFRIQIKGVGTHGSQPQLGVDPIFCAAQIISALQGISSRECKGDEPRVLSVCQVHAGTCWNVIPDSAVIEGTVRTISAQTRAFYVKRVEEIAKGIAQALRCECEISWSNSVPALINDDTFTDEVISSVQKVLGENAVNTSFEGSMGTEDFSCFAEMVPAAYGFLAISNAELGNTASVHNPCFQVDESVLWHGTAAHVQVAMDYLK